MNEVKNQKKSEQYQLWWLSRETGHRLPAGIAFYEEDYREFRLKIDFIQALLGEQDARFYVRSIGAVDGRVLYRAEAVVKKNGKYHSRRVIGEGYLSNETDGDVFIDFGPAEKILVLVLGLSGKPRKD